MDIALPTVVTPAYENRDAVWAAVRTHGPYPLMAGSAGYGEMMGASIAPWFRSQWAVDGQTQHADLQPILHNKAFIQGAHELFQAEVVRPRTIVINLSGPMAIGGAHVDTPTFRGVKRAEYPIWLLVTMGMSGLFERWRVRVAGALTWFYDRLDGVFECWPDGPDAPSKEYRPPFGNMALVADNDVMYHRVREIGDAEGFAKRARVALTSTLEAAGDGGWSIRTDGDVTGSLAADEVRVSILWKAIVFKDTDEAAAFDAHDEDLTIDHVVDRFLEDLANRGISASIPTDPFGDQEWSSLLTGTYMAVARQRA